MCLPFQNHLLIMSQPFVRSTINLVRTETLKQKAKKSRRKRRNRLRRNKKWKLKCRCIPEFQATLARLAYLNL